MVNLLYKHRGPTLFLLWIHTVYIFLSLKFFYSSHYFFSIFFSYYVFGIFNKIICFYYFSIEFLRCQQKYLVINLMLNLVK